MAARLIPKSVLFTLLVIFGFLIANAWVSVFNIRKLEAANQRVSHTLRVMATIEAVLASAHEAETAQRAFLLTGDERYLAESRESQRLALHHLTTVAGLTRGDDQQRRRADELRVLLEERFTIMRQTAEARDAEGVAGLARRITRGAEKMEAVEAKAAAMSAEERGLLALRQAQAEAAGRWTRYSMIAATAIGLVLVGFIAAITGRHLLARRAAAEALEEREQRWRGAFEQSAAGMAVVGLDARYVEVNQRLADLLGYGRDELVGKPIDDLEHPEDQPAETALLQRLTAGQDQHAASEKRFVRRDGSSLWANVARSIVRDAHGKPLYVLKVVEDVTGRKMAEYEVRRLNAMLERRVEERTRQLREVNRELESFSYSVSHDLRAPLRHIHGFTQLLAGHLKDKLDDKGRHYVTTITNTVRTAGTLIDELLSFSRMGRAEMRHSGVDTAALVEAVRKEADPDPGQRRVEWVIGDLPTVHADPAMLKQVWRNLLANAMKFTSKRADARIEVGATRGEKETTFFVRDNGVGFDMKYADKLFGVFQRLHRPEDFEGTGIGLANVRRVVLRHGGRVWAEAAPGQGATFFFTLPNTPPETGEPIGKAPADA